MPTTTIETTMPTSIIDGCVPSRWQAQLKADLDRLQALESKQPDPGHARASRTAAIESAIEAAIEEKRAVLQAQHRSARTTTLQKYMGKRDDYEPTRAVIQRVLKKHCLY